MLSNERAVAANVASEVAELMPAIARRVHFDMLHRLELPPAQLFLILQLYNQPPCRPADLARLLHVSAPTITGVVGRLERSGFLCRSTDLDDRRSVLISLTTKGSNLASKLLQGSAKRWDAILSGWQPKERSLFRDMLKKIIEAI
jgi:DNA-binding MarR family transcriptional regulator